MRQQLKSYDQNLDINVTPKTHVGLDMISQYTLFNANDCRKEYVSVLRYK